MLYAILYIMRDSPAPLEHVPGLSGAIKCVLQTPHHPPVTIPGLCICGRTPSQSGNLQASWVSSLPLFPHPASCLSSLDQRATCRRCMTNTRLSLLDNHLKRSIAPVQAYKYRPEIAEIDHSVKQNTFHHSSSTACPSDLYCPPCDCLLLRLQLQHLEHYQQHSALSLCTPLRR